MRDRHTKHWRGLLLMAVLALGALGVGGYLIGRRVPAAVSGDGIERPPAPEFSLTTIDGAPLSLTALRGKVVLVDFWATWCGPCRDEIPKLIELQRTYASRGVQLVGISMDDDANKVRAFYQELHMSYPVAVGDAALGERFGGVLGLPVKFLIDQRGRMVGRVDDADVTALARELDRLLAQ